MHALSKHTHLQVHAQHNIHLSAVDFWRDTLTLISFSIIIRVQIIFISIGQTLKSNIIRSCSCRNKINSISD